MELKSKKDFLFEDSNSEFKLDPRISERAIEKLSAAQDFIRKASNYLLEVKTDLYKSGAETLSSKIEKLAKEVLSKSFKFNDWEDQPDTIEDYKTKIDNLAK